MIGWLFFAFATHHTSVNISGQCINIVAWLCSCIGVELCFRFPRDSEKKALPNMRSVTTKYNKPPPPVWSPNIQALVTHAASYIHRQCNYCIISNTNEYRQRWLHTHNTHTHTWRYRASESKIERERESIRFLAESPHCSP